MDIFSFNVVIPYSQNIYLTNANYDSLQLSTQNLRLYHGNPPKGNTMLCSSCSWQTPQQIQPNQELFHVTLYREEVSENESILHQQGI